MILLNAHVSRRFSRNFGPVYHNLNQKGLTNFPGGDNEEVFFSLEDDVPVSSSKPMKAAPVAEEEETNLEDVEILDANHHASNG